MFDLLGAIFQKVGLSIGGTFIAIGTFLGAGHMEESQVVVEPDAVQSVVTEEYSDEMGAPTVILEDDQPEAEQLPVQEIDTSSKTLQIENVKISVEENTARVSWTTTLPAESRLIFENGQGRVFESENGLSTYHNVYISGLEESKEYDFLVSATTADKSQKDDLYDTVFAEKFYTAVFGETDDKCQIILIKDTAGYLAVNKSVVVKPTQASGTVKISKPSISKQTNLKGEVEYCEVANTFKITGDNLNVTISK